MTDAELYALCLYQEAGDQPYEGKVAIARVIANRMAEHWFSDGTVTGTVLRYDQFSWAWFEMDDGAYKRIASTPEEAAQKAAGLLPTAEASAVWPECQMAVTDGARGSGYAWGPQGRLLDAETRALLYVNLAISTPDWATPQAHICKIFAHDFYRA